MVKLKEGVTGFIYDSSNGMVIKVFYSDLTPDKIETINEVIDDDACLIINNEDVNSYFNFDVEEGKELVLCEEEGLNLVIEWVN